MTEYNRLKGFSVDELQAEIERKMVVDKTRPVPKPEFDKLPVLKAALENMIHMIITGESDPYDESERMQLIYEAAVTEAFGPDISQWIDANI